MVKHPPSHRRARSRAAATATSWAWTWAFLAEATPAIWHTETMLARRRRRPRRTTMAGRCRTRTRTRPIPDTQIWTSTEPAACRRRGAHRLRLRRWGRARLPPLETERQRVPPQGRLSRHVSTPPACRTGLCQPSPPGSDNSSTLSLQTSVRGQYQHGHSHSADSRMDAYHSQTPPAWRPASREVDIPVEPQQHGRPCMCRAGRGPMLPTSGGRR